MTPKQQRFVEEYLKDPNATQAAIKAGYNPTNADVTGPRMLGNVGVAAAIKEAQEARSERTKIDADWVLTRLADEAQADLADLYDENGHHKPVADWPLIWRQGLVAGLEVNEEFEDGEKLGQVTKVKLSDRIKRLELIGKHVNVQAYIERKELEINIYDSLGLDDKRTLLAALIALDGDEDGDSGGPKPTHH